MGQLGDFTRRIEEKITAATQAPHWESGEDEQYMSAVAMRRERFERRASQLSEKVIQPRLEVLAHYFSNASLAKNEPLGYCSCWFGYSERFPATTKVEFAVQHDVQYEQMAVRYEAWMMPVFIKLDECDKISASLDELKDKDVADWVEQRLLEFLAAYLRIDRGCDDFDDEVATDPVCGMRIGRSKAVASANYVGHPYFFCSRQCQEKFVREPTAYVEVKAM